PKSIVPSDKLYPQAQIDTFKATFTRLQKAALMVNTFKLAVPEVALLSDPGHNTDFNGFDLNALPLARDAASAGPMDQNVPALFKTWQRVNAYVTLRNNLPKGDVGLMDVFAAAPAAVPSLLAQATGWDPQIIDALMGTSGF